MSAFVNGETCNMARRPAHFGSHTSEETHLRFKDAVARLGMSVDAREEKLHDIPIDGVRLGDRLPELRKPQTSFYGQSYMEARSAAMLMVDLGLEKTVRDVRRLEPPAPDVEVCFQDGSSIFIEQTMILDEEARRLSTIVDDANAMVVARPDEDVRKALDTGLLTIRLDLLRAHHLELGLTSDDLAAEVCTIASELQGDAALMQADAARHPLLHQLDARIWYRLGLKTGAPIQSPMDHGRSALVECTLRKQLLTKIEKARRYPSSCKPLWLLIDIDHHFGISSFERTAREVLVAERAQHFNRIVVQQMRYAPIVIDNENGC